ncbi:hypothetical protein GCM10011505_01140 [Tistrella bauzanensis]|uniref:Phenylacetic acid degradation protein n=1 Tax=Tistrella bauzanensis TaxID=657419 RepID=A0ABQ1I8C8_9PROT|nr:Phenylacetic acid catabolic protein [Tistrella bauzanensis]GGB23695.1 hypothetical protein GCM10011505_01140 [Tistrella bauzanensis]
MTEQTAHAAAQERLIVPDATAFRAMPDEYQELVIHQLRAHTEGELTGADDYIQIFYPLAPNAYERKVCCERAAEEMDHYIRGKLVLDEIGIDTAYMLQQHIDQREFYRTEGVRRIENWLGRGMFSFIGEAAVLAQIHEMSKSSYKPIADMCTSVIIDEHNHVAQGYRIVWEICQTEEGLADAQKMLEKAWPITLDLFGSSESKRSPLYVKWGLRQYTNEEARARFIKQITPRVEVLGLKVPEDAANRKFL